MGGSPRRPLVLLATCARLPDGEPGHEVLDGALAQRGVDARWVRWDDEDVAWDAADLVAVRSTWDYDHRLGEFLGWASGLGPTLLNGARAFRWNTDKRYLLDLERAGLAIVPSVVADDVEAVRAAASRTDVAVVKPCVGAGGRGLRVVQDPATWEPDADRPGPWLVQPLVDSIHHDGETSVFVIGGHPVSQALKLPSAGDVRVHQHLGGTTRPVPLDLDAALLATEAIATAVELVGVELAYGRVDLMRYHGRLVVSEVEVTEPGLYLDVLPDNASAFADLLRDRLALAGGEC